MKPGAVIVDLAAGQAAPSQSPTAGVGGNCPLTEADQGPS